MSFELKKLQYSHMSMADQLIATPFITNRELAVMFGVSPAWIGIVKNSDLFREFMVTRRGEMVDPVITATLDERYSILARQSLDVLMEKLSAPTANISDELALEAAKRGARANGVGGYGAKAPAVVILPPADRIERLAARLEALRPSGEVVDVEMRSAPEARPQQASSQSPSKSPDQVPPSGLQ